MNLAIFVSGSGTNCENIIKYFQDSDKVHVTVVISNRADAYALVRAERLGVPTEIVPKKQLNDEAFLMPLLRKYNLNSWFWRDSCSWHPISSSTLFRVASSISILLSCLSLAARACMGTTFTKL